MVGVADEMSVIPLLARPCRFMPLVSAAKGPATSVTMMDACKSALSKPGNLEAGENPGGGASITDVPVTRIAWA
jgi:hypothetical protein